jgi:hypothetical protein
LVWASNSLTSNIPATKFFAGGLIKCAKADKDS